LIIIRYYSRTQLFLVLGPLAWSGVACVALPFLPHPPRSGDPIVTVLGSALLLSLLWASIVHRLTNHAYESGNQRFLGMDISKNLQPSRAERIGINLNRAASLALGLAWCAWLAATSRTFRDAWPIASAMIVGLAFLAGNFFLTWIELVLSGFRFRPLKG
jgi:hypothetical protein